MMNNITDAQFATLKAKYYELGRMTTLAFYGDHHTPADLLKTLDDFRKLIIGVLQNGQ